MPKIKYIDKKFHPKSMNIIVKANEIVDEYIQQGFVLTLRQLYYQFVARDLIPNSIRSYKRLGNIINDARLAGLIDWKHITDRTRNLKKIPSWANPGEIIQGSADSYHMDLWKDQTYRPEVWIEKDALVGVIEGVCQELDIPYFSCRGYTSQSEMWVAAMRLVTWRNKGSIPIVIHLGDHDPSGMDMTTDITKRLRLLADASIRVKRIALNMDQVEEYNPPPNPAKSTDARFDRYVEEFGNDSWELDALEPQVINQLIRDTIEDGLIDWEIFNWQKALQEQGRARLQELANGWED